MQFWPGVRPNQRQRALGNYLYRATVGRTVQKYGQRLLDRYGNYTVATLKKLGGAAGALPGNTTSSKKMAWMNYRRTGRRAGGARKRWVRRTTIGKRRRRGPAIPSSLRRYITKMANSGKERLHKSYAGELTGEAQAPFNNYSSVWAYYKDMTDMEALKFKQGADKSLGDDQVAFTSSNSPWAYQSLPIFDGDYIFVKKTSMTFEITLNDTARLYTTDTSYSSTVTNFPWIVRFIVYKPRDSNEDETFDLFRTLNGDKIGFDSYRSTTIQGELETQQIDMRNMVTKGILNKKDFVIVKDVRFQLGAGNVAACVSKKIPITFNFNKNEKISSDRGAGDSVNLADITDSLNDNARRARYYNYRFMILATPTIPNVSLTNTAPINVNYHGVTLGHD